jgi:pyrrolysine biosynthesis protein PylD
MSRLQPADVRGIPGGLAAYDRRLRRRIGCSLLALACRATGTEEERVRPAVAGLTACVVPMSCGQGIIPGFAEAVCAVAGHLGFRALVTASSDAAGLAEACERGADILLAADDERFVAIRTATRRVVDNGAATGCGFATGLDLLAGGVRGRAVLLIGCGQVGRSAARALAGMGALLAVVDRERDRAEALAAEVAGAAGSAVRVEAELEAALARHTLLLDASPAAGIIDAGWVGPAACASAPGVPLGLTPAAARKIRGRLLHDPLQIGVAVMLVEAAQP